MVICLHIISCRLPCYFLRMVIISRRRPCCLLKTLIISSSEALLFFENVNHLMNGQKEAEVEHDVQELVICCSTWLRPTRLWHDEGSRVCMSLGPLPFYIILSIFLIFSQLPICINWFCICAGHKETMPMGFHGYCLQCLSCKELAVVRPSSI